MQLVFKILGEPKAKQSTRFTKSGFSYTDKTIVSKTENSAAQLLLQIPKEFMLLDRVVKIRYEFLFGTTKSVMTKKEYRGVLNAGGYVPKTTKPDIDNLIKFINDCMNGLIFKDDAIVHSIEAVKGYAIQPCINITIDY